MEWFADVAGDLFSFDGEILLHISMRTRQSIIDKHRNQLQLMIETQRCVWDTTSSRVDTAEEKKKQSPIWILMC